MAKPKVVVTDDSIHPEAIARLRESFDVRVLPGSYPDEAALIEASQGASAILARMGIVTASVIEAAPTLRIIARHGVGVDAVDIAAATAHGVVVTSTGAVNAAAVAEYSFALLLALARKVPLADVGMRQGGWNRECQIGVELDGKTLGIIGLGAIGGRMARQALGFGMRVLAHSATARAVDHPDVELVSRDELLGRADVVSLHGRMMPASRHTLDEAAFRTMKRGTLVVNTARGELIDEAAMIRALEDGRLGGAALDTFEQEPLASDSPLRRIPNVVLSPHVAGQTSEAMLRVGLAAARAIYDELDGRHPMHVFNPEAYDRRQVILTQTAAP